MTNPVQRPVGEISTQTIAMPKDANWNGDIFGGWLVSQMDLACSVLARCRAKGRVATVAIDRMSFLRSVPIGSVVSCYTELLSVGNTSMKIQVEVWIRNDDQVPEKVTEGLFTFVAIDDKGRKRSVPPESS